MKITKGRIRQIIAEEIAALDEKDGPRFNAKLHTFLADKLGEELGSLIAGAVEDYAPQSHKDRIYDLTDEMIVMEARREMPVGADIDMMADEEDESRPGGRAYIAPPARGGRLQAIAPRQRVKFGGFDRPLQADVGQEIIRLSRKAGQSPMGYLKSLGFSPGIASNLLGMAGMFDDAEEGMTFRESKHPSKRRMRKLKK